MLVHQRKLSRVICKPPFGVEGIRIGAEYAHISVLNPAVDTNNCLLIALLSAVVV